MGQRGALIFEQREINPRLSSQFDHDVGSPLLGRDAKHGKRDLYRRVVWYERHEWFRRNGDGVSYHHWWQSAGHIWRWAFWTSHVEEDSAHL